MSLNDAILDEIDQRVASAISARLAMGTVTNYDFNSLDPFNPNVNVAYDGSSVSVPVKRAGNQMAFNNDRVVIANVGSEEVILGTTVTSYPPIIWRQLGYQQTSGTATTVVTFDNIPQNFTHLQVMVQGRSREAVNASALRLRCNGDSGGNYDSLRVENDGAIALTAVAQVGQTSYICGHLVGTPIGAGPCGTVVIELPYYTYATFWQGIQSVSGQAASTADTKSFSSRTSGRWAVGTYQAVTKLEFGLGTFGTTAFDTSATFILYGWG